MRPNSSSSSNPNFYNPLSPSSNASSTRYILPGDRLDMQPEPEIGCSRRQSFVQAIRQVGDSRNRQQARQLLSSSSFSTGCLRPQIAVSPRSDLSRSDSLSVSSIGQQHKTTGAERERPSAHSKEKKPVSHGNFLNVSDEWMQEIRSWKRSMVLVLLALLYGIFAFAVTLFTKPYASSGWSSDSVLENLENLTWTQEMIAAWHRDRPLVLATHFKMEATRRPADSNLSLDSPSAERVSEVRECGDQSWVEKIEKTSGSHSGGTSARPQVKKLRRRKFTALNGCLFRRDATSDPLGDLCCCAGQPRWTLSRNHTTSTTANSNTSTDSPPKHYLRPQILCFVSGSASLFNPLQLEAPIVGEYSLKHAHNEHKGGRCVVCSCCHEHEPDKVNKLLVGVALHADEAQGKWPMLDRNGNQRRLPSTGATGNSLHQSKSALLGDEEGFWDGVRGWLMNMMRKLDQLFFSLLDVLDLSLLGIRQGISPPGVNDSSTLFFYHASLMRPPFHQLTASTRLRPNHKTSEPPNLFIDEDAYDAFTTTTPTTSSSTTTTRAPTVQPSPTHTSTTSLRPARAGTLKGRQRRRRTRKPSQEPAADSATQTTTTKSPTVIINVYAGNQNSPTTSTAPPLPAPGSTTTASTTPTGAPRALASTSEPPSTNSALPIQLHIQLDNHTNASSEPTTSTRQPQLHAPHLTNPEQPGGLAAGFSDLNLPASSSINFVTSPLAGSLATTGTTPNPILRSQTAAPKSGPASIVISVGEGNSTTVIATINATGAASSTKPSPKAASVQQQLLSLLTHPDEPPSQVASHDTQVPVNTSQLAGLLEEP